MKLDIKGDFVPACLVQLDKGEEIYSEAGLLVYSDPTINFQIRAMNQGGLSGILKRTLVGGLPYHMHVYTGPGYAAFSRFTPGEVRSIELAEGQTVDIAEHSLLLATNTVKYDTFYVRGTGRIGRTLGFWMDRLTGPGTVVFHGHGNILTFKINAGETTDIDHGSLLLKDASVNVKAFNQQLGSGLTGHALSFEALHVDGNGQLLLQTLDPSRLVSRD